MMKKNPLAMISCILITIGALNWGLVGLGGLINTNLNLVNLLVGTWPMVEWIVYLLVGVSAIVHSIFCFKGCCGSGKCSCK
jgi:uncharacterized membrane protein YuzA (DUF378 family)